MTVKRPGAAPRVRAWSSRSSIPGSTVASRRRFGVGRFISIDRDGDTDEFLVNEHAEPGDLVGHGTACAGIIRSLAPATELVSVRVLGPNNRAKGRAFVRALEWVVEQGIDVVNLSLSSRSEELFPVFHDIVDDAYFRRCLLVSAASNTPGEASYPRSSRPSCRSRRTTSRTHGRTSTTRGPL